MAQNVTIAGASYTDVPSIEVPKTGGGVAKFIDTSDANATAGRMAKGSTAYVNGVKVSGTLVQQAAKTITPSATQQVAVESGRYTTGAVVVSAVQTETKVATSNGTVVPTDGKLLSSVTVSIPVYNGSVT